jgi:hypothetical protein
MTGSGPDRDGTPLYARSFDEADLYVELLPCEVCGRGPLKRQPGVSNGKVDGQRVVYLDAVCDNCGHRLRFAFRMPDPPTVSPRGNVRYGGDEPSQLFDPGQWLMLADLMTVDLPEPDQLPAHRGTRLRNRVDIAAAAVTEVLKFIKPDDDRVRGYDFWTDAGRQMFDEARWRFTRESLESERDRYRRALAALDVG